MKDERKGQKCILNDAFALNEVKKERVLTRSVATSPARVTLSYFSLQQVCICASDNFCHSLEHLSLSSDKTNE